jgi:NDP-sugar pyrophosphorylase family protein
MMNVLVLAAGQNTAAGDYPLCLTEFNGVPLIERLVSSCDMLKPRQFIFALLHQDMQKYHLDSIVRLLDPKAAVIGVPEMTSGAACTALLAVGMIDNDDELLILSSNELVAEDFSEIISEFRAKKLDAGVVTFSSLHPRYSYVRLDKDGMVVETAEKNPIGRNAVASFYWFLHGKDFVRAAQNMIRKDAQVEGSFYICLSLNELVLEQKRISTHSIDLRQYHPLKDERQVQQFEAAIGTGKVA